jgi:hypothetical protein
MSANKKNLFDTILTVILALLIGVVLPIMGIKFSFGYSESGVVNFILVPLLVGMLIVGIFFMPLLIGILIFESDVSNNQSYR